MKYYVKFCEEKYNIAKLCRTFNVAPLSYYSQIEGDRKDEKEGRIKAEIKPGTTLKLDDSEEFDTILTGKRSGGFMTIAGKYEAEIHFNVFIYCLSHLDINSIDNSYGKKLFGNNTNSYFMIPEEKINNFILYLRDLLWDNLTIDDFDERSKKIIQGDILKNKLTIQAICKPVKYVKSKIADIMSLEQNGKGYEQILDKLVFEKEIKYAPEQEVRIAFIPFWGEQVLNNNKKSKIFPIYPNYFELSGF